LPLDVRESSLPPGEDLSLSEISELASGARPIDLQGFKVREKERILEALERAAWNRAKAAHALGMPRRTFYRRLTEFGILGGA
jgi:transcriptional regulator of acetoin/glycerol metabolism